MINPHSERLHEAIRDVDEFGVEVLHQSISCGQFAFVNISRGCGPGDRQYLIVLGTRGSSKLEVCELIPVDEPLDCLPG